MFRSTAMTVKYLFIW